MVPEDLRFGMAILNIPTGAMSNTSVEQELTYIA